MLRSNYKGTDPVRLSVFLVLVGFLTICEWSNPDAITSVVGRDHLLRLEAKARHINPGLGS